jgi:hypothetical protein
MAICTATSARWARRSMRPLVERWPPRRPCEEHRGRHGDDQRERHHRRVELQRIGAQRESSGVVHQAAARDRGDRDPEERSRPGQHEMLEEELPAQLARRGAEGRAHR